MTGPGATRLRPGWWSTLLVIGVLAVNAASVWEIAMALRVLRDHGRRALELATAARARTIESSLSMIVADLAFLANSLPQAGTAAPEDAGPAMLLFLRGHAEVSSLVLRRGDGQALVEAGRPRGVPGYWRPAPDAPFLEVRSEELRRVVAVGHSPEGTAPLRLEAILDAGTLLREDRASGGLAPVECRLRDGAGRPIGGSGGDAGSQAAMATAKIAVSGATDAATWKLECSPALQPPTSQLEPLVKRHRTMILLNLAVMALAAGLGLFAFQQARRRQQLEARARADRRVRELERQLFHAERLGTVGRLAAGMAHEINNPLEGMANYLRLARESLQAGDPDDASRHLDGVREGVERAAGIVCRVLDHANPAAPPHEVVDAAEVVAGSVEFVRSRQEFSMLRFESDLPRGRCPVMASPVVLGQVFLNLVLNACEAQPDGGEVAVSCRRDGDHVVIEVADRGPGVPPARRGRIFEPFETTKQSAGLGLSICHSIVQQHGGELTLHDREGGGSIFRVRLRAVEEVTDAGS
ncbi:MAG: ATP-binding protein [Acidobacteriota bacterium]|jgi:signal transduction histidine kinase